MVLNRSTLIGILIFLGVLYVFFITYLVAKAIGNKQKREDDLIKALTAFNLKKSFNLLSTDLTTKELPSTTKKEEEKDNQACDNKISTNFQTDFFIKSAEHAEKVLKTKVILEQYKYGNWMDLTKLDDATKESIVIAIRYMSIEPIQARNLEKQYRTISEEEKVPLWMVILHEAVKKVISSKPDIEKLSDDELFEEIKKRNLLNNNTDSTSEPKIIQMGRVA